MACKPAPTPKPRLLVVEDDPGLATQLKWAWDEFDVTCVGDREAAIAALRQHEPDVVTLDLGLPPDPDGTTEGFAVLDAIMELKPDTKVIVASGHGAAESAMQAIARGAYDFYRKPVKIEELALIVRRALHLAGIEAENRRLAARAGDDATVLGNLVTGAPEMIRTARTVERIASADVSVMLIGASGTGKDLLARGLHAASARARSALVAINCAAIPEHLLESELFGYAAGAFEGAHSDREGRIEMAHGGTLFLDEMGDLPPALQARLLRFIETRAVERMGSDRKIPVDARIVCATNRDLSTLVAGGAFREDLYFRLAEVVVTIPPLVERSGDAPLLARHFLARFAAEMNPHVRGFAPDALAAIDAWHWPGNVRELENRVKRAVIMADGRLIGADDLDLAEPGEELALALNLKAGREQADRKLIRQALARSEGNISSTARMLGISRPTLYDLMKQYDLST